MERYISNTGIVDVFFKLEYMYKQLYADVSRMVPCNIILVILSCNYVFHYAYHSRFSRKVSLEGL